MSNKPIRKFISNVENGMGGFFCFSKVYFEFIGWSMMMALIKNAINKSYSLELTAIFVLSVIIITVYFAFRFMSVFAFLLKIIDRKFNLSGAIGGVWQKIIVFMLSLCISAFLFFVFIPVFQLFIGILINIDQC